MPENVSMSPTSTEKLWSEVTLREAGRIIFRVMSEIIPMCPTSGYVSKTTDKWFRHAFNWLKGRWFFFKYSHHLKAHIISVLNIVGLLTARHGGARDGPDNAYSFFCWTVSYQSVSPYLKHGTSWAFSPPRLAKAIGCKQTSQ